MDTPARTLTSGQTIRHNAITGTITGIQRRPSRTGPVYRITIDTGAGLEALTLAGSDTVTIDPPPTDNAPQRPAEHTAPPTQADATVREPLQGPLDVPHPFSHLDAAADPALPPERPATGQNGSTGSVAASIAHRCACRPVSRSDIATMLGRSQPWVTDQVKSGRLMPPRWVAGRTDLWCVHDIVEWADRANYPVNSWPD